MLKQSLPLFMMDDQPEKEIAQLFGLALVNEDPVKTRQLLEERINEMLDKDFERLISILYRLDVPEKKLIELLEKHPTTDAAIIITDLVIKRQLEKIESRRAFGRRDNNISEEESW